MIYAFSTHFSCFHMKRNLSYIFGIVVEAIRNVKSVYGVKRNWQGDPCAPKSTCGMALSAATMVTIPPGSSLCEFSAQEKQANLMD